MYYKEQGGTLYLISAYGIVLYHGVMYDGIHVIHVHAYTYTYTYTYQSLYSSLPVALRSSSALISHAHLSAHNNRLYECIRHHI